jgi:hypothetical protein
MLRRNKGGRPRNIVDVAYRFFKDRLPYRVRRFIEDNGNKRIESITVYRQPIMSIISKLLNILSLGRWDQAKSKIGYDDLYHLYMIVQFNDDTRAIIEKNQDVNVTDDIKTRDANTNSIAIDMKGRQPTLFELLDNTRKGMGDSRFYSYDFRSNNCQDFLLAILQYNGMSSPQATSFIKQPLDQLVKTLPPDVAINATAGTKAASYINRFLQAIGMRGFKEGGLVQ